MTYKEFKEVYEQFWDKSIHKLEYPNVPSHAFWDILVSRQFSQITDYFLKTEIPYTESFNYRRNLDGYLAKRVGLKYVEEYDKKRWNKLREIFNNDYRQTEYLREKYIAYLNDELYQSYFEYARWLTDALVNTNEAKQIFESQKEKIIKTVIVILAGRYSDIKYILDHQEEFEEFKRPAIVKYIIQSLPWDESEHEDMFFMLLYHSNYLRLNIYKYESYIELLLKMEHESFYNQAEITPVEVKEYSEKDNVDYKNTSYKKPGRNYDTSAPQKPIERKVHKLAEQRRFQRQDGTPKPTSIRDEIADNHPELMGDIKSRALFDRVKNALEVFDTQ